MGKMRRAAQGALLCGLLIFFCSLSAFSQDFIQKAQRDIRTGDIRLALETLQNGIRSNPKNVEARFLLGNLYFSIHDYRDAAAQFKGVLILDPKNVTALNNLGFVEQTMGNYKAAISFYQRGENVNPSFAPLHQNLALLYAADGQVDAAMQEFRQLSHLHGNLQVALPLSRIFLDKNAYGDAVEALQSYLALDPRSGEGWLSLSQAYLAEKKGNEAYRASQRALILYPNNTLYLLTDARAAEAAGDYSQATQDANRALELVPQGSLDQKTAQSILQDIHGKVLEKREKILAVLLLAACAALAGVLYYLFRGRKVTEAPEAQILRKWEEDLQALSDLQEIADFLVAYFGEYFKIPRGMFFLVNREGTELKCTSTNLKVLLSDTLGMNPDSVQKWVRVHQGKLMTTGQAYKTTSFHEAFPGAKEMWEKHDMRLMIPLYERGKILALLLLGGLTKGQFRDMFAKIRKKMETAQLLAQKAAGAIETAMLYEMSVVDEQTQVYNKRFFRQVLLEEMKRVERYNQPCSLLMMDIDHFKNLNDTFGHPQGDTVLKELAQILKENVREGMDSVSRYGGEEFAVILPATDCEKARESAERIRTSVYGTSFSGLPPNVRVSVSIGVASYPDHAGTDWELIKSADQALYQSKKGGRNRVTLAESMIQMEPQATLAEGNEQQQMVRSIPPFHSFQYRLEGELRRAIVDKYPVSIAIFQVNNFAQIGSPARLLVQIASLCQPFLRVIDFYSSDREGRLVFMLSEKKAKEGASVMQQICKKAQEARFSGVSGAVKFTAGVATFPEDGQSLDDLMKHAELAGNSALKQGAKVMAYQDVKQPV